VNIEILKADLTDSEQVASIIDIVDSYAREPMAGGEPLAAEVRDQLVIELASVPGLVVFLALFDSEPAGVAVCFRGYSTFKAKPLLNIHDFAVLPEKRNHGLGRALLRAIDEYARESGCCKVTLEVREDNIGARRLYRDVGFGTEILPTIFLEKRL
jgi:ribosomal protein S18 acetylase RimI-like enzyme